jgi:hypothetical protein
MGEPATSGPNVKLAMAIALPLIIALSVLPVFLPESQARACSDQLSIAGVALCVLVSLYIVTTRSGGGFQAMGVSILAGMSLFLVAEVLWGYYEMALGENVPYPSLADLFWILGYGPLIFIGVQTVWKYHDYLTVRNLVLIFLGWFVFFVFFVLPAVMIGYADSADILSAVTVSAYPFLDSILLLFLVAILAIYRRARLLIYWRFLTAGIILFALGDLLYAHFVIRGIYHSGSLPDIFLLSSYLVIAFGLILMLRINDVFDRVEPTGKYTVDHVFLLYKDGSLLSHAISDRARKDVDGDRIISMLVGIQDFARDSFDPGGKKRLDELNFGDLRFLCQKGAHVFLVASLQGQATPDIRKRTWEMVNRIESRYEEQLSAWPQGGGRLSETKEILETLLSARGSGAENAG